jgi:hypothetical protein
MENESDCQESTMMEDKPGALLIPHACSGRIRDFGEKGDVNEHKTLHNIDINRRHGHGWDFGCSGFRTVCIISTKASKSKLPTYD